MQTLVFLYGPKYPCYLSSPRSLTCGTQTSGYLQPPAVQGVPELRGASDGVLNRGAVLTAEEVVVERGGSEEELQLRIPQLGGSGWPHGQGGERRRGVPINGERGCKLRLEMAVPQQRGPMLEEAGGGSRGEEAQGAVEHVLQRRDGPEDRVGPREEGVGQQLEARRRGGERGEDEQRALEVRLGGGGGAAASRGEADPRAGLGEREERGGVGRAQRGVEAGHHGQEVAAALRLVGQREEPVRACDNLVPGAPSSSHL